MPPSRFSITRRVFEEEDEDLWDWNTNDLLGIDGGEKKWENPVKFFPPTVSRGNERYIVTYSLKNEQFLSLFFFVYRDNIEANKSG